MPAFLLDHAGRLLHLNEAADTALAAGGGLVLRAGELTARAATQTAAIADAIRLASAPTPLDGHSRTEEVALGTPPGTAGRLLFYRLPGHARMLALWARAEVHAAPPAALLRARWGLTAGEAALCLALVAGARLAEIAKRNAVSTETLRTQLKSVFAKTGTHRQSDLIRLLHTQSAAPLRL